MYAVFRTGGKQFRAVPGAQLRIPSMEGEAGESVTFHDVLVTGGGDDGSVSVGTPSVPGAAVRAEILRQGRGDKIIVFKRKRRKNYRRKQGHRQGFTEIRVHEIVRG